MTFSDFHFQPSVVLGLADMGFDSPTPIQQQAIPLIMDGCDLVACAQTGTGKTAAYVLPVLDNILYHDYRELSTLIIAPTRELALQIDQQIEGLAYHTGINSIAIYGGGDGNAWEQQKKAMMKGADIAVATPGRLISLITTRHIDLSAIKHLILDEADRMLDMGFYEDIMRIVSYLPTERQTLLFSATMPPKIRQMASRILRDPKEVSIAISKPAEGITQLAYSAYEEQKEGLLKHILAHSEADSVIIFASTKEKVKQLDVLLRRSKLPCKAFHSDLEQQEREIIMRQFRNKELRILIGTDILSRGIDVDGIGLVINFDAPPDPEDYVHRVGRTARADAKGTAITIISPRDQYRFHQIESLIGYEVKKEPLPAKLGEAPVYNPKVKPPSSGKKNFKGSRSGRGKFTKK